VLVAAFLVVGGCAAVVGTVGVAAYHEFDGVRRTANDFLLAAERNDATTAQSLTCANPPPGLVQDELAARIVGHHVLGVSVHRSGFGGSTEEGATVTADVTLAGGVHQRQQLFLRRELGEWRICLLSPSLAR
jgi:hypothetical protein